MAIKFEYEFDPTGIVASCTGILGGEEMIAANAELAKSKRCVYQLIDFSHAERIEYSFDEMHKSAIQDYSIDSSYLLEKIAIVGDIGDSSFMHQLFNDYELFSTAWVGKNKSYTTKLFRTLDEARA